MSGSSKSGVVVFGAGGHGKVVADILRASGVDVLGFLDDGFNAGETVMGMPLLGGANWLESNEAKVALGVGSNHKRAKVAEMCRAKGKSLTTAIHPSAVIASTAKLGEGAVVMAGALINSDAMIGEGAIVNTGAVVEHDCVVGAYAHISPNATLAGNVSVGKASHVGAGAVVIQGLRVGLDVTVGAGAVVIRDVPDGETVVGVPAEPIRRSKPAAKLP